MALNVTGIVLENGNENQSVSSNGYGNENDNDTRLEPIAFVYVSRQLVTYVIPVLFGCGTVGNMMTIAVLLRRGVRQNTTTFYLFVLSVSDLLCLYVGMPVFYVNEQSEVNLRDFSGVLCRLHTFLTYCFTHLVAWTIVAMQVDRTIWVALPFKARQICTIRNAGISMLVIVLVLVLFNNHFLWTLEVRMMIDGKVKCMEMNAYEVFANHVVGLMDVGMFSLVPSAIMFVCNTIITLRLKQFAKNRSRLLSRQTSVHSHSHSNASSVSAAAAAAAGEHQRSGSFSQNSSSKERSLTIMLQTVSTFFIVTTLPVCATNLAYAFAVSSSSDPYSLTAMVFYGLQTIANLLAYLNISVQFILYFLSCKNFRTDVRDMINTCLGRCVTTHERTRRANGKGNDSASNGTFHSVAMTEHTKLTESIAVESENVSTNRGKCGQRSPVSKSILKHHSEKTKTQPGSLARATISVHA